MDSDNERGSEMTRDETIEATKAEHRKRDGYSFDDRKIEAAIDEGLVDGDKVHLGGKLIAHIHEGVAAMVNDGETTAAIPIESLTDEQRDRMLVLKAVQTSKKGYSIG